MVLTLSDLHLPVKLAGEGKGVWLCSETETCVSMGVVKNVMPALTSVVS